MDYKDYFIKQAEELAILKFGIGYENLTNEQQKIIDKEAEETTNDYLANQIDNAYENDRAKGLGKV